MKLAGFLRTFERCTETGGLLHPWQTDSAVFMLQERRHILILYDVETKMSWTD